jgi:hypothetical protein
MSDKNLNFSGRYAKRTDPAITPHIFPIPPKTTKANIKIEKFNVKLAGSIDATCEA